MVLLDFIIHITGFQKPDREESNVAPETLMVLSRNSIFARDNC